MLNQIWVDDVRWLKVTLRSRLWNPPKNAGFLNQNVKSLSYDFQVFDFVKISFHKNYIRMVFRQCDSIHVVLNCIYNWLHSHIHRIWNAFVLDLRLTSSLRITQHPDSDGPDGLESGWPGWRALPIWIRLCRVTLLFWFEQKSHSSHLKGFSPVWIRLWIFKYGFRLVENSQRSHLYGHTGRFQKF